MRNTFRLVSVIVSSLMLIGVVCFTAVNAGDESSIEKGKEVALSKTKGNCLACHMMDGGEQAGNIGPPLIVMKARYPDKSVLRAQIHDARTKNANTIMPPFGPHGILSEKEIDNLTDYIHSL